jgi:branched-chain amino acid transport system ATP-binding protein
MRMLILNIDKMQVNYGKRAALREISISVDKGTILTLIGNNGAGKSSILRAIVGLVPLTLGKIYFYDKRIDGLSSPSIVSLGISLCPERRRIFPKMTVLENLRMGGFLRKKKEIKDDLEWIHTSFPILKERSKQLGGSLSGGEQQMLAMGRALMAKPELLLLDEPSLGLAPLVVLEIGNIIRKINEDRKVTVILVEQNARMALKLSTKGYVIETGKIVLEDASNKLLENELVKKVYLGG